MAKKKLTSNNNVMIGIGVVVVIIVIALLARSPADVPVEEEEEEVITETEEVQTQEELIVESPEETLPAVTYEGMTNDRVKVLNSVCRDIEPQTTATLEEQKNMFDQCLNACAQSGFERFPGNKYCDTSQDLVCYCSN